MPRRRPDKVIEERRSLGSYERQLEQDKITVEGMKAAAIAVSGIAQGIAGLGIGGGILLGAVFFKGEIDEVIDKIKDLLPTTNPIGGGPLFSPEWIASWGDSPSEQVMQDNTEPYDSTAVDSLVNDQGQTLANKTPYEAYKIGAVGRDAEYTHRIQTETANMTPAQVANYMNYPTSRPPPLSQSLDGYSYQLAIRETVARRLLTTRYYTLGLSALWDWQRDVADTAGYVADPMLDWAACVTYVSCSSIISNTQKNLGRTQIEFFMFWKP